MESARIPGRACLCVKELTPESNMLCTPIRFINEYHYVAACCICEAYASSLLQLHHLPIQMYKGVETWLPSALFGIVELLQSHCKAHLEKDAMCCTPFL